MQSEDLLRRWKLPLSQRLGRAEEAILEDGLLVSDFPNSSVHIEFEDGSELTFRCAFYLGDVDNRVVDNSICRIAVFSQHVGHYEFWIGPDDHIEVVMQHRQKLDDLLGAYAPDALQSEEERAWDNMPAVGREFGSPDYERLMEQDRATFQLNLSSFIQECQECRELAQSPVRVLELDEHQDAVNVQTALQELGQHVSLDIAAEVWRHHSRSLIAQRMSGAQTVISAQKTLFFYGNNWQDGGR